MSQIRALYRLQKIDLEIDQRLQRIEAIAALLEQDEALRAAQAQVTALQETLRPKETRTADINLELQTVTNQIKQLSERLYSGKVRNPRELEDVEHKLAERQRRRERLEDALLELMIETEDLQSELAQANAHLANVRDARVEEHRALQAELEQLHADLARLKKERKEVAHTISAENLALYKALRARKHGRALSPLQGESCSVCGVRQTTQSVQRVRQGQEIVTCASCGRILIAV